MMPDPVIHLVFKTHLDIGFTDLAAKVIETYLTRFIPQAIALARHTRETRPELRFNWTTGAWLIDRYLETSGPAERRAMEDAIAEGDIHWHALPFTTHTELMDASLFRFGLSYGQRLDARFGRRTRAAKMTDVPGHSRAIVPLLAEAGIQFLHLGVNEASSLPEVPPVFVWRDRDSDSSIIVMYNQSYGELTRVAGIDDALAVVLTGDNLGPPSEALIAQTYADLQAQMPGASVRASTMDAFVAQLESIRDQLPVIDSEIGDTWIHGVGTDPLKLARYREASRLRQEWLARSPDAAAQQAIDAFSEQLIMIPEHTWGLDEKTHLLNHTDYARSALARLRQTPAAKAFEASWQEQRAYLDSALAALSAQADMAAEFRSRLDALQARPHDLSTWTPTEQLSLHCEGWQLQCDPHSGAITQLSDAQGQQWASRSRPLARFHHQLFSAADYARFWQQFIRNKDDAYISAWAREDYTKPGMEQPTPGSWSPQLRQAYRQGDTRLLLLLDMPAESIAQGAAQTVCLEYAFSIAKETGQPNGVDIELSWFDKAACRLPEAFWLSFEPDLKMHSWAMQKLGSWVSPSDVVSRGARSLHAIEGKVRISGQDGRHFSLESLDAALLAPGRTRLLDFDNELPASDARLYINLYNNIWGTNFPMWFEDDMRWRFQIRLQG